MPATKCARCNEEITHTLVKNGLSGSEAWCPTTLEEETRKNRARGGRKAKGGVLTRGKEKKRVNRDPEKTE